MRYVSTRGQAPAVSFKNALVAGLAPDGGLYHPESWPTFSRAEIAGFQHRPYAEVAFAVFEKFVDGEIKAEALRALIDDAYASFHHRAVAPLVQMGPNDWMLELFHGPTLAFKDIAMQILARLMEHVLHERGERRTIVGATSGDTGGAALDAFKGRPAIDVFFLYPDGRISEFQRRQMTTLGADNAHAISVKGSFDDCQAMVKAMFGDVAFANKVRLAAVNSINWCRIIAQSVYYFTAAAALGAPDRPVSFAVPTGNFGDAYAGLVARRMGLAVEHLIIATNENDILARTLATGVHRIDGVTSTITPAMDIQLPSNFERALFELSHRDTSLVTTLMGELRESGFYRLPKWLQGNLAATFMAGRANCAETTAEMLRLSRTNGYVCDPHTGVASRVAREFLDPTTPMIFLGTAHPAKFFDTVLQSVGIPPQIPTWAAIPDDRPERVTLLDNDQALVEDFILERVRG